MDVAEIIKAAGGPARVAKAIGRTHATVLGWRRVPAEHVRNVARLARLDPNDLRPDLYDPPVRARRMPEPPPGVEASSAAKPPGVVT